MRSRLALVPGLLVLSVVAFSPPDGPRAALAGDLDSPWTSGSVLLQFQAAYAPVQVERFNPEPSRWGYAAALSLMATERWWVRLDASRFEAEHRSVSPYNFGLAFGPHQAGPLRPWIGFGAGYYRIHEPDRNIAWAALGSSGNLRDAYDVRITDSNRGAGGGYLATGFDWMFAPHLGISAAARSHLWHDLEGDRRWDGFTSIGLGLTFLLAGDSGGRWASR